MSTEIDAARLLVYRAAWLKEHGRPTRRSWASLRVGDGEAPDGAAIRVLGGYGYTKEFPVERFYRDAKITEIYEGTSEIQRLVIARSVLELKKRELAAASWTPTSPVPRPQPRAGGGTRRASIQSASRRTSRLPHPALSLRAGGRGGQPSRELRSFFASYEPFDLVLDRLEQWDEGGAVYAAPSPEPLARDARPPRLFPQYPLYREEGIDPPHTRR